MAIFLQCSKNYFRNSLYELGKAMCKREIVTWVQQRFVCDIKQRNVIEITVCVHIINDVMRIKNSKCLSRRSDWMIITVLAMYILSVRRKLLYISRDHLDSQTAAML